MITVTYTLEAGPHRLLADKATLDDLTALNNGNLFAVTEDTITDDMPGQIFGPNLHPKTDTIPVSTGAGSSNFAKSTLLSNGNIMTAFDDYDDPGQDVGMSITSPTGASIRSSFAAPTFGNNQYSPAVSALHGGGYVLAWTRDFGMGDLDTRAQIYDNAGNPVGEVISVDSDSNIGTYNPSVAGLKNGGFVVAFTQAPKTQGDTTLWIRLFDAAGNPAGSKVELDANGAPYDVEVIGLADGGFALAYADSGWAGGSAQDISFRIYNADGLPRSDLIRANATSLLYDGGNTDGVQEAPALKQLSNGDILVGWESRLSHNPSDINARIFDLTGHAVTGITKLAASSLNEIRPAFAPTGGADAVAVWSAGAANGDYKVVGSQVSLVRTSKGSAQDEKIKGDALTDHIFGKGGADKLYGGKGGDRLDGGAGFDKLYAGKGDNRDVFVFGKGDSGIKHPDRIYGFDTHAKHEQVWDKIDLSEITGQWRNVELHDDGKNVKVLIDYKGGHSAEMVIEVVKVHDLSRADFIL